MSAWYVKKVIMDFLNADSVLPPIYDRVDANAPKPYGTFGPPVESARGRLGKPPASTHSIEINWWGLDTEVVSGIERRRGDSQVGNMAARARDILHGNLIEIPGATEMILLRWEQDTYIPEIERNLRRVRQLYRVNTR